MVQKIKEKTTNPLMVHGCLFLLVFFSFFGCFFFLQKRQKRQKLTSKPYLLEACWLVTDPRVDYKENLMLSGVITGLACCFTATSGVLSKTREKSHMKTRKIVELEMYIVKLNIKKEIGNSSTGQIFFFELSSLAVREVTSYECLRGENCCSFW